MTHFWFVASVLDHFPKISFFCRWIWDSELYFWQKPWGTVVKYSFSCGTKVAETFRHLTFSKMSLMNLTRTRLISCQQCQTLLSLNHHPRLKKKIFWKNSIKTYKRNCFRSETIKAKELRCLMQTSFYVIYHETERNHLCKGNPTNEKNTTRRLKDWHVVMSTFLALNFACLGICTWRMRVMSFNFIRWCFVANRGRRNMLQKKNEAYIEYSCPSNAPNSKILVCDNRMSAENRKQLLWRKSWDPNIEGLSTWFLYDFGSYMVTSKNATDVSLEKSHTENKPSRYHHRRKARRLLAPK